MNEIAKQEQTAIQQVEMSPIQQATKFMEMAGDIDIDRIERLLQLQREHEADKARNAYHEAMANFKKNPPAIIKDRMNGHTKSKYAGLSNVTAVINKALSEHGLTASWEIDQSHAVNIKVTCTIVHVLGYSESTSFSAPPDKSGNKSDIHAIASTISYGERYTLLAATGLATDDMDNDGNGSPEPPKENPKPSAAEQRVIDAICKDIAKGKDKTPNVKAITRYIYAIKSQYPQKMEAVKPTVEYLINKYPDSQLFS